MVFNPSTGALLSSTNTGVSVQDGNLVFAGQNIIMYGFPISEVISMPTSDFYPG